MTVNAGALVKFSLRTARQRTDLWFWGCALAAVDRLHDLLWDKLWPETLPTELTQLLHFWSLRQAESCASETLLNASLLIVLTRVSLNVLQGREASPQAIVTQLKNRWLSSLVFSVVISGGAFVCLLAGKLVGLFASGLAFCWTFAAYLGLPVLAREPVTGIAALRRSWRLIRLAWRPRLAGLFEIFWRLSWRFFWPTLALGVVLERVPVVALKFPFALAIGLPLIAISAVTIVADQIFDAALYITFTEGIAPDPPADNVADLIFRTKPAATPT